MKIQLIRNATLRITYANQSFLIDPYLAPKHALPSFTGRSRNPMVDLPCSPDEVINQAEMVLVSHLHPDHFDTVAQAMLPKDMPLFCQPVNETAVKEMGFTQVMPISKKVDWQGISISRVAGRHGSTPKILQMMGEVSGFVLQAKNEPTIYWAGDTVWYTAVKEIINTYQPDIIITHSCGAVWGDDRELIVMDAKQTVKLCQYAPNSKVIATHMETLDHSTISRQELRAVTQESGISDTQLLIPNDGEAIAIDSLPD